MPSAPKKFYTNVSIEDTGQGWEIQLDGRPIQASTERPLLVPTKAAAVCIQTEWDSQVETLNFDRMIFTSLAKLSLTQTPDNQTAMVAEYTRYCETDLLSYLANAPAELIALQTQTWAPIRDWAGEDLGIQLNTTNAVTPIEQPAKSIQAARKFAEKCNDFQLTGLIFATGLFGSALLGAATLCKKLSGEAAYDASILDDTFQQTQWGVDADAAKVQARRREDAIIVAEWFRALA